MTDDRERQRRAIALASAIAVTLGFLASLDRLMSEQAQWSLPKPEYIETRLIDRTVPAEPIVPTKSAPASQTIAAFAKRKIARSIVEPAMVPRASQPQQPLDLFTRDGAVRLPPDQNALSAERDDRRVMAHKDLIPIEPERFAWAKPANETLGGAIMRKITNHKWLLPGNVVVSCEQGEPSWETPIVIVCRPGTPHATSDELRAMRVDPPPSPAKVLKPHRSASFAHKGTIGRRTFALLRD